MTKVSEIMKSNKKHIIMLGLITCIYFLRLFFLDQDLPPWGIGYYQPVDEGAYSLMALNWQNYNTINPDSAAITGFITGSFTSYHLRVNIIGNALTYLGLKLIGDNYYGLRLPYVIIGFVNLIILYKILTKLESKNNTPQYWYVYGVIGIVLFDFMYYMSTRVAETSSLRMTAAELLVLVNLVFEKRIRQRGFLSGFIITISVFGIYITNSFLYIIFPTVILFYLLNNENKELIRYSIWFILGCATALILAEIYYYSVWNVGAVENAIAIINSFKSQNAYTLSVMEKSSVFSEMFRKLLSFLEANCFTYNIVVLFAFIICIPQAIYKIKKDKDYFVTVVLSAITGLLVQTLVVEDYIGRKCIIIYPLVLLLCYYLYTNRQFQDEWWKKIRNQRRVILAIWISSCALICFILLIHKLCSDSVEVNSDYGMRLRWFIGGLGTVALLLAYVFIMMKIYGDKNEFRMLIVIAGMCTFLVNIGLIFRYQICNPTFYERDSMKALGDYVNDNDVYIVGGGYQLGFTLYNDMKYILTATNHEGFDYMKDDSELYFIDYSEEEPYLTDMQSYHKAIVNDDQYYLEPVYIIKRSFQTFGDVRSFSLYRLVKYE